MDESTPHTLAPVKDRKALLTLGQAVIATEAAAVGALESRLDEHFLTACDHLLSCSGRLIVCGIGKSGHIGRKLAATLASTGSPAFFVHAAEASHGDLGMLQKGDVVIALSYSGASQEMLALIPGINRLGIPLISLCGEPESPLARASNVVVDVRVSEEACPLGLAPTASTTAMLAMGDALAIALLGARGFTEEDFARSHPGGRLGRRLLLHVSDVMVSGNEIPVVPHNATLSAALVEITQKGLGMVTLTDTDGSLMGIFTDGDLRRTLDRGEDIRALGMQTIMTRNPHNIRSDALAVTAVTEMQARSITSLPVVDDGKLVGVLTINALLSSGVV